MSILNYENAMEERDALKEYDKKYYKIRDVAEVLGVNTSTLRYWEQEFPEIKVTRSATNIRYYRPEDIELLKIIHYLLKVKGLKMEAAKEQLKMNRKNMSNRVKVLETLTATRNDLEGILKALSKKKER